jgi:hypothetical protein
MAGSEVADEVGQAANLLGLLLVLLTLFTSEQARRLGEERTRAGGARRTNLRVIVWISIGLSLVSASSIVALSPIVGDVLGTVGTTGFRPLFLVFALVWLLLIALAAWQIILVVKSWG